MPSVELISECFVMAKNLAIPIKYLFLSFLRQIDKAMKAYVSANKHCWIGDCFTYVYGIEKVLASYINL